jgi:hypothetical protein
MVCGFLKLCIQLYGLERSYFRELRGLCQAVAERRSMGGQLTHFKVSTLCTSHWWQMLLRILNRALLRCKNNPKTSQIPKWKSHHSGLPNHCSRLITFSRESRNISQSALNENTTVPDYALLVIPNIFLGLIDEKFYSFIWTKRHINQHT